MSCPKTGEPSRYSSDRAATNESAPCTRTRGRQHILRTMARPECITWLLKQTKPIKENKAEQKKKATKRRQNKTNAKKTAEQTEQRKTDKMSKAREKAEHSTAEQTQQKKAKQNRTKQSR